MKQRDFGRLQSHLFPPYFALSSATSLITLLSAAGASGYSDLFSLTYLGPWTALLTSLLNWLWVGPWSTDVMFEKYDLLESMGIPVEDGKKKEILKKIPKIAELNQKFGML